MSSLLGGTSNVSTSTSVTLAGSTVGASASGVSTSSASGSSGSASTPSGSVATSTPSTQAPIQTSYEKRAFAMSVGQTVYVNLYSSLAGINPWQAYSVGYVYNDGNAILIREPNTSVYTGPLLVGVNLRRLGDSYADTASGP